MNTVLSERAGEIAGAFVAARREARGLPDYPGERPVDLAAAYRIQDLALRLDGRPVGGWKVGRIGPALAPALGADRLAGPIFADSIVHAASADCPDMPVFVAGFAAAEAEMLLHVAPGWDGRIPVDDAGTRAILDDVRLGIEIASSPYPGINADGPCVTVSDFGNNIGSVIGAPLSDWQTRDVCAIVVRMIIDGERVGEATAATMLDGPFGAVRFLLGNLAARGIDASGGFWISTGAITGVHPVAVGQQVVAEFDSCGTVECRTVAARPR